MANPHSSLVVIGPFGERPFMRGILVQSLVSRGVPFEVALDTASKIADRIEDRGKVTQEELADHVDQLLAGRFDLEAPRYRVVEPPVVVSESGGASAFSKGLLAVSLQGAGMDPSDAFDVARELEAEMLREGLREIDRDALRARVTETIERTHGRKAAQRYETWRLAREDGKPIFVLLGGSSGVGKTSIAVEVARRLEVSHVIGTDSIRQIMRLMFSADLMPEIHSSTYDAYRAARPDAHRVLKLERDPVAPVIGAFREQAQKIAVGVHALLDRAADENASTIIEGVNLLPSVLDLDRYRERAHIISLVVAGLEPDAYRNRFRIRGASAHARAAERYIEHFDEILAIQDYILTEADALDLPIIDNIQFDDAVLSVIRSVISTLRKSLPMAAEGQDPS